jgi:hypothetical protein
VAGESVILDWNFTNWATVVIMAAVGFALLGVGMKLWQRAQAKKAA